MEEMVTTAEKTSKERTVVAINEEQSLGIESFVTYRPKFYYCAASKAAIGDELSSRSSLALPRRYCFENK